MTLTAEMAMPDSQRYSWALKPLSENYCGRQFLGKKFLKPKSELLKKKRDYKNFLISE